jgi:hypothetical protein
MLTILFWLMIMMGCWVAIMGHPAASGQIMKRRRGSERQRRNRSPF